VTAIDNTIDSAVDRNAFAQKIGVTAFLRDESMGDLTETADKILDAMRHGAAFCAATTAKSRLKRQQVAATTGEGQGYGPFAGPPDPV
jgi:Zn-dependent alcohol dehydrogenase